MENLQKSKKYCSIDELAEIGISRKSFIYRRWCALCIDAMIICLFMIVEGFLLKNTFILKITDNIFYIYFILSFLPILSLLSINIFAKQSIGEMIFGIKYGKITFLNILIKLISYIVMSSLFIYIMICIFIIFILILNSFEYFSLEIAKGYYYFGGVFLLVLGLFFALYRLFHDKYDKSYKVTYKTDIYKTFNSMLKLIFVYLLLGITLVNAGFWRYYVDKPYDIEIFFYNLFNKETSEVQETNSSNSGNNSGNSTIQEQNSTNSNCDVSQGFDSKEAENCVKSDSSNSNSKTNSSGLQFGNSNGNIKDHVVAKPILYFYPTKEIDLTVKLLKSEKITHSYPKYIDGWKIKANPDGKLVDLETGRKLYSLYREGIDENNGNYNDGFVIKGEDTIEFLEEKLAILGLNEYEAEEFIIYWLPKLESNKYNFIRFASYEEIDENMPLEFSVKPDSLIRVLMQYKGIDDYFEIQEQELISPKREGFVVVEWGGTEIKD